MAIPVFTYLRVSGKGQLRGDGFERQRVACGTYARGNDLRIVREFVERGVSGENELVNRPALTALLEALAKNGTRHILIERLDRLARNLLTQESILAEVQRRGFVLISALEPDLASDDPTRIMLRQILGSVAQYDKSMTVAKLRGARERIRARGQKCEGRPGYGDKSDEQATLAQMREWHGAGMNYTDITRRLNAEGILTRHGKPWQVRTVLGILKREGSKTPSNFAL